MSKIDLTKYIQKLVSDGEIACGLLTVRKNDTVVLKGKWGYADLRAKKEVQYTDIFRMMSMTKPVIAVGVLKLIDDGKLSLDDSVADYLPEFREQYVDYGKGRKKADRHITVRDLLNMTSGLAYPDDSTVGGRQSGGVFWNIEQRLYSDNPVTTKEFSEMTAKNDLCFEPGERFMYGSSADIAGALIERVSGMKFSEFLKENFFIPLGMEDTDFYVPKEKQHRLAKIYNYGENGLYECITNHLGMRYERDIPPVFESGGAGLCSTLDDYSRFAQMLINGGEYKGTRIMPEYAVRYLTGGGLPEEKLWQFHQWWDWMSGYTYGNFCRICRNESETSLFSSEGEYGWDGWLGTFFSNEPKHGITLLMGVQQVGVGKAGTLVRKLKNAVMSELV